MNIILSNTDSAPIYEQITRQLRAKIVSGELAPGAALPSMRLLAKELRISVITTKRAYEELEREGLIVTQTGRGSFVAEVSGERLREEQRRAVEKHLADAVHAAKMGGLTAEEFIEIAKTTFEEGEKWQTHWKSEASASTMTAFHWKTST